MTATAVAMRPSFSAAVRCAAHSIHPWPSDSKISLAPTRSLQPVSVSISFTLIEPLSIDGPVSFSHRWRLPRISAAAITQEEAAAAAAEEEEEPAAEEVSAGAKAEAEATANTKLYFGNLPYHCDSAQLAGLIQQYGEPELIEVLYDKDTGRSRGFAFVTMSNIEDCNAVIENLDKRDYAGRTLRVNFSNKPRPKEPLYPETEYKLFVGNLSWAVTSESLSQLFQKHGNVVGARVLYDGETGKSRGYGFVCYATKSEMDTAIETLDGAELEGRAIRVSLAQGRK